jgi:hypothetical protein
MKSRVKDEVDFVSINAVDTTTSKGATAGLGGVAFITVLGTLGDVNVAIGKTMPLSENSYEVFIATTMVQRVTA